MSYQQFHEQVQGPSSRVRFKYIKSGDSSADEFEDEEFYTVVEGADEALNQGEKEFGVVDEGYEDEDTYDENEGEDGDGEDEDDYYSSTDEDIPGENRKLTEKLSMVLRQISDQGLTAGDDECIKLCIRLKRWEGPFTGLPNELCRHLNGSKGNFDKSKDFLALLLSYVPQYPAWVDDKDLGDTTMHQAVRLGLYDAIEFLCERSSFAVQALKTANVYQNNCLHIALQKEYGIEFVKKLTAWMGKTMVDVPGADGNTPLHLAVDYKRCKPGQIELVKHLLSLSAEGLTTQNHADWAPLQYLIQTRQKAAQKMEEQELSKSGLGDEKLEGDTVLTGGQSEDHKTISTEHAKFARARARRLRFLHKKNITVEGANRTESQERKITRKRVPEKHEAQRVGNQLKEEAQNKEADEIEALLKLECLRLHKDRDETNTLLYGKNQPSTFEFDLSGYRLIEEKNLKHMNHLRFENYLQYVILPNMSVITSQWARDQLPVSKSRADYWYIFQWLRSRNVKRILRVVVQDRHPSSHSDELIELCLGGFDVEQLDWNKPDICSTTIKRAAPGVTDLTLYYTGKNAVLRSWSHPGGLGELKALRTLRLKYHQGLESRSRTIQDISDFTNELKSHFCWHSKEQPCTEACLTVQTEPVDDEGDIDPDARELDGEPKEEKHEWITCMEQFAALIRNYSRPDAEPPNIKVALIDDGVDSAYATLSSIIADGISFSLNAQGRYNSYYKSSKGHGTIMASLIRKVCPKVQLYVAKLHEERTNKGYEITAASAAKAVDWAVKTGVHIISMSWTINLTSRNKKDIDNLSTAIHQATEAGILIFCAVSDQGARTEGLFPAKCRRDKTFLIGAATSTGSAWDWVGASDADYILPGTGLLVDVRDPLAKKVKPSSGSSLATALAAGLAALILYCVALNDPKDLELAKGHDNMSQILESINITGKREKGQPLYLQVWELFGRVEEGTDRDLAEDIKFVATALLAVVKRQVQT